MEQEQIQVEPLFKHGDIVNYNPYDYVDNVKVYKTPEIMTVDYSIPDTINDADYTKDNHFYYFIETGAYRTTSQSMLTLHTAYENRGKLDRFIFDTKVAYEKLKDTVKMIVADAKEYAFILRHTKVVVCKKQVPQLDGMVVGQKYRIRPIFDDYWAVYMTDKKLSDTYIDKDNLSQFFYM
jgi:hypothetical protein